MKAIALAAIAIFVVGGVAATETYYTLSNKDGSYVFTPVVPEDDEDDVIVDDPVDDPDDEQVVYEDPEMQAIQYCQNFDTSQGLTFAYVEWQKQCDTNRDGEYKFCEDWTYPGPVSFSYVWWNRGCRDDEDFSPVR